MKNSKNQISRRNNKIKHQNRINKSYKKHYKGGDKGSFVYNILTAKTENEVVHISPENEVVPISPENEVTVKKIESLKKLLAKCEENVAKVNTENVNVTATLTNTNWLLKQSGTKVEELSKKLNKETIKCQENETVLTNKLDLAKNEMRTAQSKQTEMKEKYDKDVNELTIKHDKLDIETKNCQENKTVLKNKLDVAENEMRTAQSKQTELEQKHANEVDELITKLNKENETALIVLKKVLDDAETLYKEQKDELEKKQRDLETETNLHVETEKAITERVDVLKREVEDAKAATGEADAKATVAKKEAEEAKIQAEKAKIQVEEAKIQAEEAKIQAEEAKTAKVVAEAKIPDLNANKKDFKECIDIELTYMENLKNSLRKGGRYLSIEEISPYKDLLTKFKTTLDEITPNNKEVLNLVEDLKNLKSERIKIDTLHTGDYKTVSAPKNTQTVSTPKNTQTVSAPKNTQTVSTPKNTQTVESAYRTRPLSRRPPTAAEQQRQTLLKQAYNPPLTQK